MLGLNLALSLWTSIKSWLPSAWFTNNEQGVWYDPADFSTMFQDSAGTIPVTAVEQPVGLVLDKSGRGNHASQATSTKRPILSARVNLLTKTEDFADAAWTTAGAPVISAGVADPEGGLTATTITATAEAYLYQIKSLGAIPMVPSAWMRRRVGTGLITLRNAGVDQAVTVTTSWTRVAPAFMGSSGNDWVLSIKTAGDAIDIWHPQLETGPVATRYQRVNTATDYDTVGFPHYLKFDGVDDSLATASIDFTAGDKMTVVAGVRKLSDATAIIAETSADSNSNNGAFYAAQISAAGLRYSSRGTATSTATFNNTAPITNVISGVSSISTDVATLRINGVQAATSAADQGTGNFGNYPLYIGSRAGTSLPFNGHLYGLIVRGAQSTDAQIAAAEAYVNSKTGAY